MDIAIVTGASSGMGREFVLAVDREYDLDEIWVIARREDRLRELEGVCRTKVRTIPLDLSLPDSFLTVQSRLSAEEPHVRILVNAAGYGLFGEFSTLDLAEQLGIVDLNSRALTAMCHLVLSRMQAGDAIVNLGSNSSWQPVPYMGVYAASKAFVLSFSRSLGRELKNRGIHVMCVCPGWVKTEFMDRAKRDDTIRYFDRWYTAEQVADRAMRDLKKRKPVSILGSPVRRQVRLVKHLPVGFVMDTWCRQQGKS